MEEPPEKRSSGASLTDEVLIEILRRLPVRSVCRFKCVSWSWYNLISDPVHRKKLPHTLAGFFYHSWNFERFPSRAHHFTNVTGKGAPFIFPSFSFLPVPNDKVVLLDSCNGLLLCRCFEPGPHEGNGVRPFQYAVCNPATEKWMMLPDGCWASGEARTAGLGFDPAVSSHFYVVEYVVDDANYVTGVEIYSSKTASWRTIPDTASVFLNGFMHMLTVWGILVVDMEGNTWRTIPVPSDGEGCIHQSQGRLYFLGDDDADVYKLSIWILKDGTNEWTLKHSVPKVLLFRQRNAQFHLDYRVIAVHPECNLIYFVYGLDATLMAYEMDRKEVRVIRTLGPDCSPWPWETYLPYVPLFSEALADEQ